jgi:leucyl/phenylalanyl-tRNA--protein transferase
VPIFGLSEELVFPPPWLAEPDGLLAVGGDLSEERLVLAYRSGIFPWYEEGQPILWWSPNPRMILLPAELHVSQSLSRIIRKGEFEVTFDKDFPGVIRKCADFRGPRRDGTWITEDMHRAYIALHRAGYAHSVETRRDGVLVGGLYGVSLGGCFFGESMFSEVPNASKVALAGLVERLEAEGFTLIDCQNHTPHLERMGAKEVFRKDFLELLARGLRARRTRKGSWTLPEKATAGAG